MSSTTRSISSGEEWQVITRSSLTVEDVYEHLIYYRAYEIITGEPDDDVLDGVSDWFLEELKWRRISS